MKNLEFLFAAFTVIWIAIFFYMFTIAKRQKSLEKEIRQLEDMKKEQ